MTVNNCGKCGSPAVEQTRSEMGPGDYRHQDEDYHEKVELHDDNKNDMRIACTNAKCDNVTGWNKSDAPNAPGAIADFTRKQWNETNGDAPNVPGARSPQPAAPRRP